MTMGLCFHKEAMIGLRGSPVVCGPGVVELASGLVYNFLHLSLIGNLKSSPEAYGEPALSTGIYIGNSLRQVFWTSLAADPSFQIQGYVTKELAGEGLGDGWCLVHIHRETNTTPPGVQPGSLFWFFSVSRNRRRNGLPHRGDTFQKRQHHRAVQLRSVSASALHWGL